jgi:hypothetical protein
MLMSIAAAVLSAACGSDPVQDKRHVTALGGSIESARLELTRHQDAVAAASTLTALPVEIDRHDRTMGDIMGMMDISLGGMTSGCSGSGMGAVPDRMDAVTFEMRSDREAMTAAATLADARNECAAHTDRVNGLLDEMDRSLDTIGCKMER